MTMTPWIVSESPSMALHCKRCGVRYTPNLPIAINLYVALSKQFIKDHEGCEEVRAS